MDVYVRVRDRYSTLIVLALAKRRFRVKNQ